LIRFCTALMVLALAACGDDSLTRNFALVRDAPPGTMSAPLPPLSMPPILMQRPEQAGSLAPNGPSPDFSSADSAGQNALLEAAGPAAPGNIRRLVDENSGAVSLGPAFAEHVMDWTPSPGYTPLTAPAKQGWFSRLF